MKEVEDTELIDEIKSHLPIAAYASRNLSKFLLKDTELPKLLESSEYRLNERAFCNDSQ